MGLARDICTDLPLKVAVTVTLYMVASMTIPGVDCQASPQLTLDKNSSDPRSAFLTSISDGVVCLVQFNLYYASSQGRTPLNLFDWDTFSPNAWIWASDQCRNLLRLPLDHVILSLGILSIQQTKIDVVFDEETGTNLTTLPFAQSSNQIAKFLDLQITYNSSSISQPSDTKPVICRSAYAFYHPLHGYNGIGYKCCVPPSSVGGIYICDVPYTQSWELVWYGPIVLMFWIYLIGFIHFYWLYRHAFIKKKQRKITGLEKTIEEIKVDLVKRLIEIGERFARISSPLELISLREPCNFFEVLGFGKIKHSRIMNFLRILFAVLVFSLYYVIWALFIYEYKVQIGNELAMLNDTRKIFVNVVGRLGWLFTPTDTRCFQYEIFESIWTGLLPFLGIVVYASIIFRTEPSLDVVDAKDANSYGTKLHNCLRICFESRCGKIFQTICLFMFILHCICVGGVFMAYVVYFVGLGIFANVNVVSPWIIPIIICLHFFNTSFDPAYRNYKMIKDAAFTICLDEFKNAIFKANKEIFLPRDMIEKFYIPNSKSILYSCVLRLLWLIAVIFLLILIVLTIQYPYNKKLTSVVAFLGVQVVFILPLFAKMLDTNNAPSPLEETILKRDLEQFIKLYLKEHPDIINKQLPVAESVPSVDIITSDGPIAGGVGLNGDAFLNAGDRLIKHKNKGVFDDFNKIV